MGTFVPHPIEVAAMRDGADAYNRTRLTAFVRGLFRRCLEWTG